MRNFYMVFEGTLEGKPNPMLTETVFGRLKILGTGNISKEADILRTALEEISETSHDTSAVKIALDALDECAELLNAEFK